MTVRYLQEAGDLSSLLSFSRPFVIEGARNVFLETVKRGEDDSFDSKDRDWTSDSTTFTIILRLYEAFGGHARAQLRVSEHIPVSKAYVTNLLEDEGDELKLKHADASGKGEVALTLDFHGFEVKTVKLVVGHGKLRKFEETGCASPVFANVRLGEREKAG